MFANDAAMEGSANMQQLKFRPGRAYSEKTQLLMILPTQALKSVVVYNHVDLSTYVSASDNGGTLHAMTVSPKRQMSYFGETP